MPGIRRWVGNRKEGTLDDLVREPRPWWAMCLECGAAHRFPAITWRRKLGNMVLERAQEKMVCAGCGAKAGILVPWNANWLRWDPPSPTDRMAFNIEVWSLDRLHVEEVVARAGHLLVARAAYHAVVQSWPGRMVTLRQGAALLNSTVVEGRD